MPAGSSSGVFSDRRVNRSLRCRLTCDHDGTLEGNRTMNTEPLPGSLATETSPPIIRASLRVMASKALRGRGIGLAEFLEQLGLLLRRHADPGVGDGKLALSFFSGFGPGFTDAGWQRAFSPSFRSNEACDRAFGSSRLCETRSPRRHVNRPD